MLGLITLVVYSGFLIYQAGKHYKPGAGRAASDEITKLPQNLLNELQNNGRADWIIEVSIVDSSTGANEFWDQLLNLKISDKIQRQNKICQVHTSAYYPFQKNVLEFLAKEERKPDHDFTYDVIFDYILVRQGTMKLAKDLVRIPEVYQLLTKSEDENSQL